MTTHDIEATASQTSTPASRAGLLITGVAGLLVFSGLLLEGPGGPDDGATGAEVRRHYESNFGAIELQIFGEALGFLGLILFVAGVRALMRSANRPSKILADLAGITGAMCAVWLWVQASVDMIPLVAANDAQKLADYDNDTLLSLDLVTRIGETFGDLGTIPRGLFVLAVSMVIIRTRVLPRWIGHLGLFVGASALAGIIGLSWGGPLLVAWFVGLFGFLLWIELVAVTCLVRLARTDRRLRAGVGTSGG